MYKWKPNKTQRRDFAIKMQDPEFRRDYEERKQKRAEKRRAKSKFDYEKAGGFYIPTQFQYESAHKLLNSHPTKEQEEACFFVISGYLDGSKVHHDYIHLVNEFNRSNKSNHYV